MRVNRSELAEILGKSMPTITAWLDDGMPCVKGGGKGKPFVFEPADCIEWAVENGKFRPKQRQLQSIDDDGRESYEEAERRKMVANADKAELELAKAAGLVVPIADVVDVVAQENVRVRTHLLNIANKVRMAVSAQFEEREAIETVVALVEEQILTAMAEIRVPAEAATGAAAEE